MSFKTNNIKHETQDTSLSKSVALYKVYQKEWVSHIKTRTFSFRGTATTFVRPLPCRVGGHLKTLVYPASIENEKTLQQNHSFPDIYLHKRFSVWMWRAHYCILPNILGTPCILRLRSQTGSSNFKTNISMYSVTSLIQLTTWRVAVCERDR